MNASRLNGVRAIAGAKKKQLANHRHERHHSARVRLEMLQWEATFICSLNVLITRRGKLNGCKRTDVIRPAAASADHTPSLPFVPCGPVALLIINRLASANASFRWTSSHHNYNARNTSVAIVSRPTDKQSMQRVPRAADRTSSAIGRHRLVLQHHDRVFGRSGSVTHDVGDVSRPRTVPGNVRSVVRTNDASPLIRCTTHKAGLQVLTRGCCHVPRAVGNRVTVRPRCGEPQTCASHFYVRFAKKRVVKAINIVRHASQRISSHAPSLFIPPRVAHPRYTAQPHDLVGARA